MPTFPEYNPRERSWELLRHYLSKHQRKTLKDHGFFYVQAKDGHIYGLPGQYVFVAINKRTGEPGTIYGAYVADEDEGMLPLPDQLLALFLALTTKPRRLIELACKNESVYINEALASGKYLKGFLKECQR